MLQLKLWLFTEIGYHYAERTRYLLGSLDYLRVNNKPAFRGLVEAGMEFEEYADLLTLLLLATPPSRPTSQAARRREMPVLRIKTYTPEELAEWMRGKGTIELRNMPYGTYSVIQEAIEAGLIVHKGYSGICEYFAAAERPTSQAAAIRGASVAVVADLPALINANDDAKNPPVIEIKRFIGGNFQAVTINDELTLVPANGAIAKALPSKPTVIDCSDPYEEAATRRRAEHRQRRIWSDYDEGKNTADDFAPQLPPVVQVVSEQKPYVYDGRYYGSSSYYMRNR